MFFHISFFCLILLPEMSNEKRKKGLVLLADGTTFYGRSAGIEGTSYGEICFNTGVTGYQEIFTDPSYFGQIMVTTTSHIGNYGIKKSESQSQKIFISGLICKTFSSVNSRSNSESLKKWFKSNNLVTLSEVDTRALVRYIRDNGAMNAAITTEIDKIDKISKKLKDFPIMDGLELASKVSTKNSYEYGDSNSKIRLAVIDLGIKKNILDNFSRRDIYIKVFPYDTAISNSSVKISHKHLNDQTVAGLEIEGKNCFSVQYHPEAGPGPNDGNYLFDQFLSKLK